MCLGSLWPYLFIMQIMAASVLGQKLCRTFIRSDLFSHFIFSRRLHDVRPYTPRRSFLYIPGNEERKVSKASSLNSDCVVLDCEDGVAANKKACLFICLFFHSFVQNLQFCGLITMLLKS